MEILLTLVKSVCAFSKPHLKRHTQSKHEHVSYPCDQCDYKKTSKQHLKQQIKSIHKNKATLKKVWSGTMNLYIKMLHILVIYAFSRQLGSIPWNTTLSLDIWNNTLNLYIKMSLILAKSVIIGQLHNYIWNGTYNLNMKMSLIPVTNVIIRRLQNNI